MKKRIVLLLVLVTLFAKPLFAYQSAYSPTVVIADILLWKLREGSADNWGQIISPSATHQSVELLEVPFHWQAGFRVGFGYDLGNEGWDQIVAYTQYQTKKTCHANTRSGGIYSAYLGNFYVNNANGAGFGPNYFNAGIKWTFAFHTLDIEWGRRVNFDRMVKIRPKLGLKAAVINQNIDTDWQNPSVPTNFNLATENLKNHFWGVGPYLGFDSAWFVYGNSEKGINLFGNFSAGILSGHWRFKDHYKNNTPLSIEVFSDSINTAATMVEGQLGIEWVGAVLGTDATVRLGYEAQVWFNQMQYYSFNMGRLCNLMSLQGALLDLHIHF